MKRSLLTTLGVLALIYLSVSPALAQKNNEDADDPFTGTWELAVGDSTFSSPPTMVSRVMRIETTDEGIRQEVETVTNRYETLKVIYEANLDGRDYPASGLSAFTNIAMKRIDDNTIERMGKIQGKVLETCMIKVSDDGKMLTLDIKGPTYSSMQVYHRQ